MNGAIVPSTGRYIAPGHTSAHEIAPGASFVPKYIPNALGPGTEWEDILKWDYQITKPGSYTIVAVSKIMGYRVIPGGSEGFTTDPFSSNVVQIKVVQ